MKQHLYPYEVPLVQIVPVQVENAILIGSTNSDNESFGGEYFPE
jgi:hypothetical protein